jgi:hypothetical protein
MAARTDRFGALTRAFPLLERLLQLTLYTEENLR